MVAKTTNSSTKKTYFSYLGSQGRRRHGQQQQSYSVPHVVSLKGRSWRQRSPNGLTFACGREAECVRRRWLPLSDGERYRGCTAAERRITWPQRSGINARTHARTHTQSTTLSLGHTCFYLLCALTRAQTPSTRPFLRTTHSHSQTFIDHSCEEMERGRRRHRSYSIASLIYNTATKIKHSRLSKHSKSLIWHVNS